MTAFRCRGASGRCPSGSCSGRSAPRRFCFSGRPAGLNCRGASGSCRRLFCIRRGRRLFLSAPDTEPVILVNGHSAIDTMAHAQPPCAFPIIKCSAIPRPAAFRFCTDGPEHVHHIIESLQYKCRFPRGLRRSAQAPQPPLRGLRAQKCDHLRFPPPGSGRVIRQLTIYPEIHSGRICAHTVKNM